MSFRYLIVFSLVLNISLLLDAYSEGEPNTSNVEKELGEGRLVEELDVSNCDNEECQSESPTPSSMDKYCGKEKLSISKYQNSSVLSGYPENLELLLSLDSQLAKELQNLNEGEPLDLLLLKSTKHFEGLLAERYPQMSLEQIQLVLTSYEVIKKVDLATSFQDNFRILRKLDKNVFSEMPETIQKELLCYSYKNVDMINDINHWKIVVGVNEKHFKNLIRNLKDWGVLNTHVEGCNTPDFRLPE